jgi:5'-nucleotidase (lipoprotein e(P4) family)
MSKIAKVVSLLRGACLALTLTGCVTSGTRPSAAPKTVSPALPDSVHWFRDSAEQKAIYIETYREATEAARKLSAGLATGSWAVILDVDETILDNSEYQKRQALRGLPFETASWNAWIEERAATPLPGAKMFTDSVADDMHGQVVLVTNRSESQCAATADNLHKVGIRYNRILCDRVGDADKNGRFRAVVQGEPGVAQPLNVLIWVGDNIQDFPSLTQHAPGNSGQFGTHYFALPNPMYGSWQKVPAR